jgi:hypothetical protein
VGLHTLQFLTQCDERFVGGFGEAQSGALCKAVIAWNHKAQALDLQLVPSKPGSVRSGAVIARSTCPPARNSTISYAAA